MTVTLTQTRIRPDDQTWDVDFIGINYRLGKVVARVRFASGDETDVIFEGPSLTALRNAVPQFAGLRRAMEEHIVSIRSELGGTVT